MFPVDQLLILVLLALVGEPLRRLMSTGLKAFKSLDIFQVVILDFYLGGFVFFIIASIPLGLFTPLVTFLFIGVSVASLPVFLFKAYISQKGKSEPSLIKKFIQSVNRTNIFLGIALLTMFLMIMWIEAEATTGILFGNVHDASLFSMLSSVIAKNGMIPANLSPFDPAPLIYPQGFTVILSFTSYVFNTGPETMILMLVPLFQALGILGAYFLGKMWSGKISSGVIFAFMFAFVSRWPKLLVWGSYAFVAAFPLYLLVLSLVLFSTKPTEPKGYFRIVEYLFFGLLLGYVGAIHATYYEVIVSTFLVIGLVKIFTKRKKAIGELLNLFTVFVFSLIPVSVFLSRFLLSALGHIQNVGLPTDIAMPQLISFHQNFYIIIGSFFGNDWISPYPVLRVVTAILIIFSIIVIGVSWKKGWLNQQKNPTILTLCTILGALIVVALASKELGVSFFTTIVNIPETAIVLFISLIIFVGIATAKLYEKIHSHQLSHLSKATSFSLISLLFILSFSPFIYYTVTSDTKYCQGQYNLFAVATNDDYQLMMNIRGELPSNSVILINSYEAGGFIPSVAGYKVVYPFTGSSDSKSYRTLCNLILDNNLNKTTYDLMDKFNITHIFVGSRATYYQGERAWDSSLFLGNPNFKLLNKVGGAFLFAYTHQDSPLVFFDDFENHDPLFNGWRTLVSTKGNGTFNVSIASKIQYRVSGDRSLMLVGKANPNTTSLFWLQRMIYLPTQNGNGALSFYLNSSTEFRNFEGLTFIISEENFDRKLSVATWNRGDAVWLQSPGFYEFDLSSLWFDKYNTTLPSRFVLQIELYNSDGKQETFFIDSLQVRYGLTD